MLCFSPGMYAVITLPLLSLTRAVFRSPEFGFFGLVMPTFRHTPFICGARFSDSAGDTACRARCGFRHPRRTWLRVAQRDAHTWKLAAKTEAAAVTGEGV